MPDSFVRQSAEAKEHIRSCNIINAHLLCVLCPSMGKGETWVNDETQQRPSQHWILQRQSRPDLRVPEMTCILGQWERDLSDPFLRLVWPRAEKVSFVHSRLVRLAILGGSATFRENSGVYFDIFLLLSNERCTTIIGLPYLTSFRSITYATLPPSTQ